VLKDIRYAIHEVLSDTPNRFQECIPFLPDLRILPNFFNILHSSICNNRPAIVSTLPNHMCCWHPNTGKTRLLPEITTAKASVLAGRFSENCPFVCIFVTLFLSFSDCFGTSKIKIGNSCL